MLKTLWERGYFFLDFEFRARVWGSGWGLGVWNTASALGCRRFECRFYTYIKVWVRIWGVKLRVKRFGLTIHDMEVRL